MRQQNNGRRRQNRGPNRRNFNSGYYSGNLNKNTVIDSAGPLGRQRGSVSQLSEKYVSLASDALSSDDRILAESFLQFADHYYRIQKDIEINNEAKEAKAQNETQSTDDGSNETDVDDNNKNSKRPSRRKRGFQIRENELSAGQNNYENKNFDEIKKDKADGDNLLV